MTSGHTIRLHSAWKRMVSTPVGLGEPQSVSLPDQSLLLCDAASVTYRRHFNRPTGIGERTSIRLECGFLALAQEARLNGIAIELPIRGLFEITSWLRPHNELEIVVPRERFAEASAASAHLQIVERA